MSQPDAAAHVHHAIVYIEITVTDGAEAKRFYGAAFGSAFNDYGLDYAGIQGPVAKSGACAGTNTSAREVPWSS